LRIVVFRLKFNDIFRHKKLLKGLSVLTNKTFSLAASEFSLIFVRAAITLLHKKARTYPPTEGCGLFGIRIRRTNKGP
jgi:hypothetical protein